MCARSLDDVDRKLILLTQAGLPLVARPYAQLAQELNISEEMVMARFQAMLDRGVVRRIAAVPHHYRVGYGANAMSVWDISDERVDEVGKVVGALPFVSHCYRRPRYPALWPYNLFAMLHGRSRDETDALVRQIAQLMGTDCRGHAVLYSSKVLKKAGLRLKEVAAC